MQHAHQKAIIHRDLKPANILVVEIDGKATPRIIDFGLAKIDHPMSSRDSLNTRFGSFVGTPGYMSPEQADPAHSISTPARTCIRLACAVRVANRISSLQRFRLGKNCGWTKCFATCAKTTPCAQHQSRLRRTTSREPMRKPVASKPRQLVGALHGDLDWISMRALEKDRNRRYATPIELAADIQRYLQNIPVVARPASAAYRTWKYAQRHRVAVGVALGAALLLTAFAVVQAFQLRRITRERDRADQVAGFMKDIFKVSDPSEARGNSVTAREILDKAASRMDTSLAKDPVLRAEMMAEIGEVSQNLGLYSQAHHLLENALQLQRSTVGPQSMEAIKTLNSMSRLLLMEGRYPEAEALSRDTLALARRRAGPKDPDSLDALTNLATSLKFEGHYPEAEKTAREGLDIARAVYGEENTETLHFVDTLASTENRAGKFADAEKLYRQAVETQTRIAGSGAPQTLLMMNNLAANLADQGRFADAEKIQRALLDIERRVLGPEHPETLASTANLANYVSNQERYADAEKIYREVLAIQQRILPDHPETLRTLGNLANLLADTHRYAEAETLKRSVLEKYQRIYGRHHPETATAQYDLACLLARQGRSTEAISFLQEALGNGLWVKTALNMYSDSDLKSLHGDPRFEAIASTAREQATAKLQAHP